MQNLLVLSVPVGVNVFKNIPKLMLLLSRRYLANTFSALNDLSPVKGSISTIEHLAHFPKTENSTFLLGI